MARARRRAAPGGRRSDTGAHGARVAALGALCAVATLALPWSASGTVRRSGFALAGLLRTGVGIGAGAPLAALASVLPLLAATAVALGIWRHRRSSDALAALAGLSVAGLAAAALAARAGALVGPLLGLVTGAAALAAALVDAAGSTRRQRGRNDGPARA